MDILMAASPQTYSRDHKEGRLQNSFIFIGLFIVVSGLEKTGVLTIIAGSIGSISGGHMKVIAGIVYGYLPWPARLSRTSPRFSL
jgi:Na+/H+ antiporter NhaD/arsenite permease-like protein